MVLPAVAFCFRVFVALARSFAGRWFVSPATRSRRPPIRDRPVHDANAPIGGGHVALTAIAIASTTASPIAALRLVRSAGASGLNGFQLTTVRILAVTATAGVVLGLWRTLVHPRREPSQPIEQAAARNEGRTVSVPGPSVRDLEEPRDDLRQRWQLFWRKVDESACVSIHDTDRLRRCASSDTGT
jgi:hypothetical protein